MKIVYGIHSYERGGSHERPDAVLIPPNGYVPREFGGRPIGWKEWDRLLFETPEEALLFENGGFLTDDQQGF
jgi:hypothetical protein